MYARVEKDDKGYYVSFRENRSPLAKEVDRIDMPTKKVAENYVSEWLKQTGKTFGQKGF